MLTKKIANKNSIAFADSTDQAWVEIVRSESTCTLILFAKNIPEEYRGKRNTDIIKRTISCPSPAEAQRCQEALAALISNGYGEPLNWHVAMDLEDMINIFGGEMGFCELTIDTDNLSTFSETISDLKIMRKAFIYLRANNATINDYVLDSVLSPSLLAEEDIEIWRQYSINNDVPINADVVDVWYC